MMKLLIALVTAAVLSGCQRTPDTVDGIIAAAKPLELNAVEKDFVAKRTITMAYPRNIEPTIYDKDGKVSGYSAKVTELVQKRTGLKIKYVLFESNATIVPAFIAKEVDAAMAATDIIERRSLITVSHPYTTANGVMVVDQLPIKFPMKVAIGSKYAVQESIAKLAGLVQFVPFENDELGFQALMRKEVGAAIMAQPIADFLEKKYDRPYAHSSMNFVYAVGYGCQVTETMMCQILNKGVDSITSEERRVFDKEFYVKDLTPIEKPIKYGPP